MHSNATQFVKAGLLVVVLLGLILLLLPRTRHPLACTPNRLCLFLKLHVGLQILVGLLDNVPSTLAAILLPILGILNLTFASWGRGV